MKDLSSHILDIAQNSTAAHASLVTIDITERADLILFRIIDNGCGMDSQMLKRVSDPFFTSRTTRKVGLGIPLLIQNAQQTGGSVDVESQLNVGTTITARFSASHIDCPPWGDLPLTIALLMSGHPNVRFVYSHAVNDIIYQLDSDDVKSTIVDISIQNPKIIRFINNMIHENLSAIGWNP